MRQNPIISIVGNIFGLVLTVIWFTQDISNFEPYVVFALILGSIVGQLLYTSYKEPKFLNDQKLFNSFLEVLPFDGSIDFIINQDLLGHFKPSELDDYRNFLKKWADPKYKFNDKKMQDKLDELYSLINDYDDIVITHTFPSINNHCVMYPDQEVRERIKDRIKELLESANSLSNKIMLLYNEIICYGKRKYKINRL